MHQLNTLYKDIASTGNTDTRQLQHLYIAVRNKENRLYTDEELLMLPKVNKHHVHWQEWQIRQRSCNRLLRHLRDMNKPLRILEIGCGNGWLSNRLSEFDRANITGLDINITELNQARNVFGHNTNLHFLQGDIRDGTLDKEKFDVVIFAASIQYFSSISAIISKTVQLLNIDGEIHIMDSMFYSEPNVRNAKSRSDRYFNELGFPEMSDHYFHHALSKLQKFNYKILSRPATGLKRMFAGKTPFYWVVIKTGHK